MDTTRKTLLVRVKDPGDSDAWRQFDAIYRPMLHRFATARGLKRADAEDIVQHCLVAVSQHIGGFEYDPRTGRFKAWLRTIVNNRIRNIARKAREKNAKTHDFDAIVGREDSPDELFDQLWRAEHLRHCLTLMKSEVEDSTFNAFKAYVLDEKPVDQVCKTNGMTKNQVQLIKWRVTNKLRQHMKSLVGESE